MFDHSRSDSANLTTPSASAPRGEPQQEELTVLLRELLDGMHELLPALKARDDHSAGAGGGEVIEAEWAPVPAPEEAQAPAEAPARPPAASCGEVLAEAHRALDAAAGPLADYGLVIKERRMALRLRPAADGPATIDSVDVALEFAEVPPPPMDADQTRRATEEIVQLMRDQVDRLAPARASAPEGGEARD